MTPKPGDYGGEHRLERSVRGGRGETLRAGPAARFVKTAAELESDVRVVDPEGGETADAESLLAVTGVGSSAGTERRSLADRPDAASALDAFASRLPVAPPHDPDAHGDRGHAPRRNRSSGLVPGRAGAEARTEADIDRPEDHER